MGAFRAAVAPALLALALLAPPCRGQPPDLQTQLACESPRGLRQYLTCGLSLGGLVDDLNLLAGTASAEPVSLLQRASQARRHAANASFASVRIAAAAATASQGNGSALGSGSGPGSSPLPLLQEAQRPKGSEPPDASPANAAGGHSPLGDHLNVSFVGDKPLEGPGHMVPMLMQAVERTSQQLLSRSRNSSAPALIMFAAVLILSCMIYFFATHWDSGGEVDQAVQKFFGGRSVPQARPPAPGAERMLPSWQQMPPSAAPSSRILPPRQGPSSPGRAGSGEEFAADLPIICPQLVITHLPTRLAVPCDPLLNPEFEIDVLSLSQVPLLTARLEAAVGKQGSRGIQISLHSVDTLLAIVTPSLQLLGPDGAILGTLVKDGYQQYVLRSPNGRPILNLSYTPDAREIRLVSMIGGRTVQRSTVTRRPAGHSQLPAEHYEVVTEPNVDAVLALACLLALVVFSPVAQLVGGGTAVSLSRPSGAGSLLSLAGRGSGGSFGHASFFR
mmetsp:Transcript_21768/g.47572  ORF Transcript_21768/g.47572 Transcript_21768/m.47572 type:complete len:503 (-) Transcript_21768:41-1549(-)